MNSPKVTYFLKKEKDSAQAAKNVTGQRQAPLHLQVVPVVVGPKARGRREMEVPLPKVLRESQKVYERTPF